jgi:hypothetical protein
MLADRSEEAIRDGLDLYRWCFEHVESMTRSPLDLGRQYRLPHASDVIFGEAPIGGKMLSVMGTRQLIRFSRIDGSGAGVRLREFVTRHFLERGHWTYPNGDLGGFGIHRLVYRGPNGDYGKFAGEDANGAVDWRDLGTKYRWVLLRVDIHDFVMPIGPFNKKLEEAACVVAHPDFVREVENPAPGYELEVTVGYPFIKFAPIPNFFGFGPGKFEIAIKCYSFLLKPSGDVDCRMYFAAAPRCEKVFDFGPSIPDPVYGGASLLSKATFGSFNKRAFHDRVDSGMLAQHCRVHQAFIEGSERVFQQWLGGK